MADFEQAFKNTMGNEGGYANNPRDRGGETYMGISRKNWPAWTGWALIDAVKGGLVKPGHYGTTEYRNWAAHLDKLLLANTSVQNRVAQFYRENFWKNLSAIADQTVATEVFDKSVNCGQISYRWLQRAVGCVADGVIGPKTIEAVNSTDSALVISKFNAAAKNYYDGIMLRDPTQTVFKKSWYRRLKNYDGTPYITE